MMNLMYKGVKTVQNTMKRNGYVVVCDYEESDNMVVEFAKVTAGVTTKSVVVVFSPAWRVVEVR